MSCWSFNVSVPSLFPGLDYGEEVIVWSNSCPDPVPDFFVRDSVSEWDAKDLPVAPYFIGLDPSFLFSCEDSSFTCVEEGWCDHWTKYLDPVFGDECSYPSILSSASSAPMLLAPFLLAFPFLTHRLSRWPQGVWSWSLFQGCSLSP